MEDGKFSLDSEVLAHGASIRGSVAGETQNGFRALAGVTVQASGPALAGFEGAATDASGDFIIPFLPAGTYTIQFSLDGYFTETVHRLLSVGDSIDLHQVQLCPGGSPVSRLIERECSALAEMLLEKNRAYGNSALDPVRCFSRASAEEQLRVRLDDKLSRIMRGDDAGEDVELDLMGYLVLLRVQRALGLAQKVAGP